MAFDCAGVGTRGTFDGAGMVVGMKPAAAIIVGLVLLALFVGGGGYGLTRFGVVSVRWMPENVNPCNWSIEVVENGKPVRFCPARMN